LWCAQKGLSTATKGCTFATIRQTAQSDFAVPSFVAEICCVTNQPHGSKDKRLHFSDRMNKIYTIFGGGAAEFIS